MEWLSDEDRLICLGLSDGVAADSGVAYTHQERLLLGVFCCKTIWQALKRNIRIETTDAATHSCREGCGDESMLRGFSVDGVLQQNRG